MKKQTLYQTLATLMVLLFVGTGLAYGADPQVVGELQQQCFELVAGQNTNAGTVCVSTDGVDLVVTYTTINNWTIKEAQLWIGNQLSDMPQTKTGNPIPGQFPFKSETLIYDVTAPTTKYTFSRALSNPLINFTCDTNPGDVTYYMAAHASLQKVADAGTYQTETAWSAGSPITSKGSWATFSTFTLTCVNNTIAEYGQCETDFAKHLSSSTCFNDLNFQRWGWTNGPFAPGTAAAPATYTFEIWAGAAQCVTNDKGMLAGTLTVTHDGSLATVTYDMNTGWVMNETQLYVGSAQLPLFKQGKSLIPTVAPGQYPYLHEDLAAASTDTYTVNITGPFYVVAHAVTCH